MGWKRPKQPEPLGEMPPPGGKNPRFYTPPKMEPQVPQGGFQSIINASPAFGIAELAALAMTPQPRQSFQQTSGNASRNATSRALADLTSTEVRSAADEANQKFQSQAQKGIAEDYLSQQQTAQDRNRIEIFQDLFGRNTRTRVDQGAKDLTQYAVEEQKNASARFWASFLGALGGLV